MINEQQELRDELEAGALDFLTDLFGRKTAATIVDFAASDAQLRYRSFTPVGSMLIGLRFRGGAGGTAHNYGFWHVNDEQELGINIALGDQKRVTILIEGFPEKGRPDRFAWYCNQCVTPLFVRSCETGRVGLGGFYHVQQQAVLEFNAGEALRTCRTCGDVHPLAYSAFDWADTPEQRAAREVW